MIKISETWKPVNFCRGNQECHIAGAGAWLYAGTERLSSCRKIWRHCSGGEAEATTGKKLYTGPCRFDMAGAVRRPLDRREPAAERRIPLLRAEGGARHGEIGKNG